MASLAELFILVSACLCPKGEFKGFRSEQQRSEKIVERQISGK
jgi:hypothetical protein